MKRHWISLFIAIIAGFGGWWFGARDGRHGGEGGLAGGERKALFYQSPMHPWIKSDKPGKCTICGMDLAPVYDTAQSHDAKGPGVVMLPPGSSKVAGIATGEVARRPLVRTLRVAGRIEEDPTRNRFLSASVKGRVDKLFVNTIGAEVAVGEPLAEIFSRELLAAAGEYKVASGEMRLVVARKLRQMGLSDAQIAELPKRDPRSLGIPLLAPMSGTVVARNVVEGQWVEAGERLLEIADFQKMWFVFDAYERDLPWLQIGQIAELRTPSHPGQVFRAPIRFIEPSLSETTRTTKVRVELENPLVEDGEGKRRLFLQRLFAEAAVEIASPEVLAVPRSAIIWPGGKPRVFVDEGAGAYRLAFVQLGCEGDLFYEVLGGIKAGDRVVTQGGVLLDGQAQINNNFEEPPSLHEHGALASSPVAADTCPVSGEKLGSMGEPYVLQHEGRSIELCCIGCKGDFEADPALYLSKLPKR